MPLLRFLGLQQLLFQCIPPIFLLCLCSLKISQELGQSLYTDLQVANILLKNSTSMYINGKHNKMRYACMLDQLIISQISDFLSYGLSFYSVLTDSSGLWNLQFFYPMGFLLLFWLLSFINIIISTRSFYNCHFSIHIVITPTINILSSNSMNILNTCFEIYSFKKKSIEA